ncbi:hypothetical protein DDZ16_10160 [Marinilabilia rubra]|uniref:Uncharacterized protein n=1 Tax=Marinilabilia rubra TaxID=2162893 RepID=A0A2U2B8J9_9BACT|nr:hypothetical protein DDZ16_10160 [Marinilabilia rubra]
MLACPFSGPAESGKPKWATFKTLRNGRKFWFSRADWFKRTSPDIGFVKFFWKTLKNNNRDFGLFLGQCQKGQIRKRHFGKRISNLSRCLTCLLE